MRPIDADALTIFLVGGDTDEYKKDMISKYSASLMAGFDYVEVLSKFIDDIFEGIINVIDTEDTIEVEDLRNYMAGE